MTFLFISHHLQEIYEICETVTVFRDARHILTAPVAELPTTELVAAMTGETSARCRRAAPPAAASDAHDGAARRRPESATRCEDVVASTVRAGEVVGIAGAGGSGKVALAETIVGLRRADRRARSTVDGRRPRPGSVPAALAAGIGFVPQDRHREGFVPTAVDRRERHDDRSPDGSGAAAVLTGHAATRSPQR